jgi:hypothetical protein
MVNLHEAHKVLRGTMTLAYLAYDASQTNRNCVDSSMLDTGCPRRPSGRVHGYTWFYPMLRLGSRKERMGQLTMRHLHRLV